MTLRRRDGRLLLFLSSYGASLKLLDMHGILKRELRILRPLANVYSTILIVTYGSFNELRYSSLIPRRSFIVFNPFNSNFVFLLLVPLLCRNILKRFNIVVCRTIQLFGCVLGILFKLLYGARFILRQGYVFTKFARYRWRGMYVIGTILEFIGCWFADYVIVTTQSDKEYIVRRYRVNPNKVIVIPNYVDTAHFRPYTHIDKEGGRIVYVGRLEPEKNVLALIDAVKHIPDTKLYIIGDGSLRRIIERKIKREGIKNVVLLGVIPNERLPEELNKSEIFVLPSLWEGHPKALIEAMACALPVVGSNVEGIRDLIKHGFNGLLCEPTPDSIREAITVLLRNPELRRSLGENARRFVAENFSYEKVMRREIALHLWLITRSRR